ncbi:ATP-dependent helicase HrpB [Pseudomonas ficuserectae]|nr:ATP-dependent helicase HrpB [Pseudomonas ficuserectae]
MISLPIDAVLPALRQALTTRHEAVLEAPPGAGKTTRVPLALLEETWLAGQTILMLEPRRLAARAAAERLASELGEKVGETVGYRIRLESRVGPKTRIEVVTEGILTRRLQDDPALEGVGLLIFDEFHERSLDADLALALSLNGRELFRDDQPLKILLMSATLEGERLAALLDDAPVVRSDGRMFPVTMQWGRPFQPGEFIEPRVVQTVLDALGSESGSLLVFLPGQAEIRRVNQQLAEALGERADILLCPLHGELDLNAQRAAIEPAPNGTRKVVLATNIAETSLTIDGVRVVIDAGLARVPRFDPGSGMMRLETQRISRASATQRAGRAGRLEPGVCYRLWSEAQHDQLAAYGTAEILQADLAGLALQLARWGVTPAQLVWLDVAAELLNSLDAQTVDFVFQQRFRHFDRVGSQQTVHDLILDLGLDRLTQLALHVLANLGAEAFDTGFLDTELLEELFVQLRQLWLGNGIDGHGELGSLAGQLKVLIVLGEGHVQNALFASLGANQTVFETRNHATGTQHQLGSRGRTASEHFAVDLAHKIDVQLVFVLGSTVGHFKTNVLLAQHFQHVVQIAVRHVGRQALYGDGVETGNGEFREYFESSHVFQVFAFFERFRLYSRSTGRVQLLLNHSFVEGSLNKIAQCFLTCAVFITLTDHAHRHLAWAEARDLGFTCGLLQTLVDFSLDAFGRHANGHAALKSGSIFNRNLHGYSSLHRR